MACIIAEAVANSRTGLPKSTAVGVFDPVHSLTAARTETQYPLIDGQQIESVMEALNKGVSQTKEHPDRDFDGVNWFVYRHHRYGERRYYGGYWSLMGLLSVAGAPSEWLWQ